MEEECKKREQKRKSLEIEKAQQTSAYSKCFDNIHTMKLEIEEIVKYDHILLTMYKNNFILDIQKVWLNLNLTC